MRGGNKKQLSLDRIAASGGQGTNSSSDSVFGQPMIQVSLAIVGSQPFCEMTFLSFLVDHEE